jgi:hypothetical protein
MDEPNRRIRTTSTSRATAQAEDIILRAGDVTRLIFRPLLIDNPRDPDAAVRGDFIFQRKSPKGAWEDHRELDLSRLKATEWIKLELHSDELLTLIEGVLPLYELVRSRGIELGRREYVQAPTNDRGRVLQILAEWLARQDLADASNVLSQLRDEELTNFEALLGLARIRSFLRTYAENRLNASEPFWQDLLTEQSWVISQVFASPFVIFGPSIYVGGKMIDNRGANLGDFLYRNKLTGNPAVVEIKTPMTRLIGGEYRNNVYTPTRELVGVVMQALHNRDSLIADFRMVVPRDETRLEMLRPRALLIIGSFENEQLTGDRLRSFEQFRNGLRDLDVVTFDELAAKAEALLELLLGAPEPDDSGDDIPW